MLDKKEYNTKDLITLALKVSPLWTGLLLALRLLSALTPLLLIMTMTNFINVALTISETGVGELLLPMLALSTVVSYQWLQGDIQKYFNSKILIATRNTYQVELLKKRASLEYCHIEDSDTYDLIQRLTENSEKQVITMFNDTLSLATIIINVISIALVIFLSIWWAALVILVISIPLFKFSLQAGKATYQAKEDLSKQTRLIKYLLEVNTGRDTVDERALFGYSPQTIEKMSNQQQYTNVVRNKVYFKNYLSTGLSGLLVALVSTFIIVVLIQPVLNGMITVGLFISLITACTNLTTTLTNELTYQMDNFAKHKAFLKDLTKFSRLEETKDALEKRSTATPTFETLQFKNVSFKYPNTAKLILDNVNLTLEKGKNYAFVGENGAGKTTLIKLLTGLYTDYQGEILLNGKDIKSYSSSTLKAFFSIAYQDFARYPLTIKENLLFDNVKEKDDSLAKALATLELDSLIQRHDKGLDTPLGKIKEDGIDLSGGQWQRLALARVMLNPAPFTILDEPTSALDPLSESRLYSQFEKMIAGKTSIFITHRLGSIKLADEIVVFKSGKVIEVGNHSKLMNKAGTYQKMYQSQLAWYQEEGA